MGCGVSENNLNNISLPSNDRYDRRELIGVGHHGRVYKSYYELDKKQYANKVIDQFRPNTNLLKLQVVYSQLINRLKKLRNDKITTYYQIDFTEKQVSIIMELSKEGTLKKYSQKNGPLSEEIVSNFAEGILQGLDYLHNAGLIHKDLKSSNVLLMPRNEIKVSDFGIAEIYDDRLIEKSSKGEINSEIDYYRGESLPYMAPEVIKNLEIIDKSDVWSMGCILIELLTGATPWVNLAENFEDVFRIISNGVIPPLPKNLSKECQGFLQSCLAVIATQRLSVPDLLRHSFIKKYSKNSSLFFEEDTSLNNIRFTLQSSDKVNRVQQKAEKSSKLANYLNESLGLRGVEKSNSSGLIPRKQSRQQRISRQIDSNIVKIREALHSIDGKRQGKPSPELTEDMKLAASHQQLHTVILNNKKVQLDPARYKNTTTKKMKTEQNEWNSPPRNRSRAKHSVQVERLNIDDAQEYYDPFKIHNYSNFEDSLDTEVRLKNLRMETEPNISEYSDRQYFKKPLKLLKKKLKESKESYDFSRKLTTQASRTVMKNELIKLQEEETEEDLNQLTKLRVYTETKREERVIDTELARAERDRFISQQKLMKKLREEQKSKWQSQLKKGAQILKDELKRYYYNPLVS